MTTMRRILVPVDFTRGSRAALRHARDLATLFGSYVHVLHVSADAAPPVWAAEWLRSGEWRPLSMHARPHGGDELATLIAAERLDPFTTTAIVRNGCAEDVIAAYADEIHADLIIMGVHGDHLSSPHSAGRVVQRVLAEVRCPVLAIPDEPSRTLVLTHAIPERVACEEVAC